MFIKIKEIWIKYKREVIVGVVVSLITAALLEGSSWLISTAPSVGDTLFDTVKNIIFSSAATQSNLHILSLLIASGMGLIIAHYLANFMRLMSTYNQKKNLNKLEVYLKKDVSTDKKIMEKYNLEISELYEKILKKGPEISKQDFSKIKILLVGFTISMLSVIMYVLVFILSPLSMVDRFQRDITVITPYSDELTIQKLESDWVCMRSENDYIEIYNVIDEIKQENNLP